MNWTKWSSIAEILSSIAILATLVVLVIEVRVNTAEVRAASAADISGRTIEMMYEQSSNRVLAEARLVFSQGGELTPSQGLAMNDYRGVVLKIAEESFISYQAGRLEEEIFLTRARHALNIVTLNEGSISSWINRRSESGLYVQDFVDWFDAALLRRAEE